MTPKLTPRKIAAYKTEARKIVMLTAYDYPSARILDAAGVDILLVGDSLGNVVQGKATTLPVTLDELIYHAEMVARAARRALVVVDLPFPCCQLGPDEAIRAAARILKEAGADAVKFEGGEKRAPVIAALVEAGVPVMAHCGLLPQDVLRSGYFVQRQRDQLQRDLAAVQAAGAFAVVLEYVSAPIVAELGPTFDIPTIGIGSGPDCDGQVLVFHDLLGLTPPDQDRVPKHVRRFADLGAVIADGVADYADAVRERRFPGPEQTF